MQRSLRVHTFSPACVHAVESSDDGSRRSAVSPCGADESRKKIGKKVAKLLMPLKYRRRISQAFRSLSMGANKEEAHARDGGGREESDADTFVSAHSSELRSTGTDDVEDSDPALSFRLSPPPIFPTGSIPRPPPASPVKIVGKLPFGYVIGRQLDGPAPLPPPRPSLALTRSIKKVVPSMMAALHIRSRSQMVKKRVARAFKGAFRRGTRRGGAEQGDVVGGGADNNGGDDDYDDDDDVFWKKDVRGLRCRRVEEDDDASY